MLVRIISMVIAGVIIVILQKEYTCLKSRELEE